MSNRFTSAMRGSDELERLAHGSSPVHRLHPAAKLFSALIYISAVVSAGRYDIWGLLPFAFYPFIMMPLSDTPLRPFLRRLLPALPFAALAGVSNMIFDRRIYMVAPGINISGGVLSFAVIMIKTCYAVTAALLITSTTRETELFGQLTRLRVPPVVVSTLRMVMRYIGVLAVEAGRMTSAYYLRSAKDGVLLRDAGSFSGQLLLRSSARASRVGSAMVCRGWNGTVYAPRRRFSCYDYVYCVLILTAVAAIKILF
jgi:cobalt/nickel transport system permease protein